MESEILKKKLLVIDGSSLFFRAFYALPLLTTKKGVFTNAVYGFVMMLENIIEEIDPSNIAVCFDMKGKTFRHEEYADYKGTRDKTPSELDQQFPMVRKILENMNISVLESPVYEADDIAGTLAEVGEKEGYEVYLLTGDRDYLQLVDEKTRVLITKKGITETVEYNLDSLEEEYGIKPLQFIDLKGLMGDKSDNIPGVPGIGEKTGLKLLKEYHSLENIYENIDNISGKKLKENLIENKSLAFLSKRLGTIVKNVPLEISLEDLKRKEFNYRELSEIYKEYEMNSLLKRLPEEFQGFSTEKVNGNFDFVELDLKSLIKEIKDKKSFAFKFLSEGKIYNGINPSFLGILPKDGKTTIFKLEDISTIYELKEVFEDGKIEKLGHGIKEDLITLQGLGIDLKNCAFDAMIAQYVLDPGESQYHINNLSNKYFDVVHKNLEDIQGKGKSKKTLFESDKEDISNYLAFLLNMVYKLESVQIPLIKEQEMEELYYKMELPLIEVLSNMEFEGVKVDEEILKDIGDDINIKLKDLTEKIHEEAGEDFNINSPKQLGVILFEKMNLPPVKKTKTGYSTSVEVLEKLKGSAEIIDYILEYRQLAKISSTYIDGLLALINEDDGRIHSSFNQTIAATGRISSTDPNLQNIPIRTEIGRSIRKAFVAGEGRQFIDADYSQIELRILAHISKDENMVQAFKDNIDIHTKTASEVFHVELDEVTPLMRSRAKAVNFGIVYGISDYGLSRDLDIPRAESREYIDNYLKHFSGVKGFMKDIVELGKEQGFVETIFHRRRYIPELSAKNFNIRSFGERIALNTPIQGSAADIIKIAMVNVYKELKERKLKSKLILQIHDELIIESYEDEIEEVSKLLREVMESAVKLDIPIDVDLSVGDSWYDTK